jgi:hypothetical protein
MSTTASPGGASPNNTPGSGGRPVAKALPDDVAAATPVTAATPAKAVKVAAAAAPSTGVRPAAARPAAATAAATAAPAARQTRAAAVAKELAKDEAAEIDAEIESRHRYKFMLFTAMPSWMVSAVIHAVMLIVLALWTIDQQKKETNLIVAENFGTDETIEEIKDDIMPQPVEVVENAVANAPNVVAQSAVEMSVEPTDLSNANEIEAAAAAVELVPVSERTAPRNSLMKTLGAATGQAMDGRGGAAKAALMADGATKGSEAAVAAALKWIVEHQMPDGGWNFNHQPGLCQGRCSAPGTMSNARNGATGLALLPLLGAGMTHKEGAYRENVKRGLYFLASNMKPQNGGGSLVDGGNMYSHGICAIALCEAYAMTHDRDLMAPAQAAINFIVYAQDPVGGGWRYQPRQPGDTSAVGWQLMALKSAHMAYLQVPPITVVGASKFLDSVQVDSGSKYGYTGPGAGNATTAVGLLSRMYLGWKRDNPALDRGVKFLSDTGPGQGAMYYNYYATQVMRHAEGDSWKKWNEAMREMMVTTQSKTGHEAGSWSFKGADHGADAGGRLYCTAMATMILEVYYRHMPIYRKAAAEEDFPL